MLAPMMPNPMKRRRRTRSAAIAGRRSPRASAHRYSMARQVAVIAATSTPAALAAKAATASIPIVFEMSMDPVLLGLVSSLSRPGGNITGVTQLGRVLTSKKLEILHQLLPKARVMALLVNPSNPIIAETDTNEARSAASNVGVELHDLNASFEREFDALFSTTDATGGLVIGTDPFFTSRYEMLGALAAHHAVPAVKGNRVFVEAGGLVGYGTSARAAVECP